MCKCSLRCVFSGRGRCLLRRNMISCLLCFFFKLLSCFALLISCCFSFCCCLVFCHIVVRLLLFLRLVMGGQTYVVVAVGWRSLLSSLKIAYCIVVRSCRLGRLVRILRVGVLLVASIPQVGLLLFVWLFHVCFLCALFFFSSVSCFAWLRSSVSRRGVLGFLCETQGRPPDVCLGTCGAQPLGFALRLCFVVLVILRCVFFRFFFFSRSPPSLGFA